MPRQSFFLVFIWWNKSSGGFATVGGAVLGLLCVTSILLLASTKVRSSLNRDGPWQAIIHFICVPGIPSVFSAAHNLPSMSNLARAYRGFVFAQRGGCIEQSIRQGRMYKMYSQVSPIYRPFPITLTMRHVAATIFFLCICVSSAQDSFRLANHSIYKALNSREKVVLGLLKRQNSDCSSPEIVCQGEKSQCCDLTYDKCCSGECQSVPFLEPVANWISSDGGCCPGPASR